MSIQLGTGVRIGKLVIARGRVSVALDVDYLGNDLLHAGFASGELSEVKGATLGVADVDGRATQIDDFIFRSAKVVCDDSKRVAKVTLSGLETVSWDDIRDFTHLMECAVDPAYKLTVEWEYERQAELDLDAKGIVREAIEQMRPKKGSGIDSITISTKDASVTLDAMDKANTPDGPADEEDK